MRALVWITDGTWRACVDAARTWVPPGTDVVLLHVTDDEAADVVRSSFLGLLGRGHPARDPSRGLRTLDAEAATALLDAAAARLGRPAVREHRDGRVGHEVVQAADGAELLICARDGQRGRLGPHSLSPATRFVVDHAGCPVLLVWPGPAPGVETLPPPPAGPPPAGPPPP